MWCNISSRAFVTMSMLLVVVRRARGDCLRDIQEQILFTHIHTCFLQTERRFGRCGPEKGHTTNYCRRKIQKSQTLLYQWADFVSRYRQKRAARSAEVKKPASGRHRRLPSLRPHAFRPAGLSTASTDPHRARLEGKCIGPTSYLRMRSRASCVTVGSQC